VERARTIRVLLAALVVSGGCQSTSRTPSDTNIQIPQNPTFTADIAPILFEHCAACHRPGQQAPFSLLDYADARTHARLIATVTESRVMPPWLPAAGYGDFADERRLSDAQIETFRRWVDQGAIEGDAARLPPTPKWPEGWQLGEPDLIVRLPQPYTLPAGGTDVFRNFLLPAPIADTRYVRAIEFQPDNPRVLHHAAVGVDASRSSRQLDRQDPEPGFAAMPEGERKVFGWSPGKAPFMEPVDRAWALDGGSDLILEMHLLPTGKPESIQPTLGLFFAAAPPSRFPALIKLESKTIDIPSGQADYVITDSYVLPADVDVESVYPHAHYLAKDMQGFATLPDGSSKWLIWIKAWNFKWQDQYRYRTPVFLPKGTTLTMRFTYDNSANNPSNPHRPPERVRNGPLSFDEMAVLWFEVLPRNRDDARVLTRDYQRREQLADIAGAEMRVRVDPSDASVHTFLATKYLAAGRVQEAVSQLEEAIRLKPDDGEAHNNLGSAFQLLGRTEEATKHLREALRLKPDDARVHFNLGNALLASGKADESTREFRRAIAIDPEDADAHYNLAVVLGSQDRIDEAVVHLERVLQINPRRADAHHNLGAAFGSQGKFDEALRHAREALRIRADSPEAQTDVLLIQQLEQEQRGPGRE